MKISVTIHINKKGKILGFCNTLGSIDYLKDESGKFKIFEVELEQIEEFNKGELKAKLENNSIIFHNEEEIEEEEEEKDE